MAGKKAIIKPIKTIIYQVSGIKYYSETSQISMNLWVFRSKSMWIGPVRLVKRRDELSLALPLYPESLVQFGVLLGPNYAD